jgi:3-dehydroquinate synthase
METTHINTPSGSYPILLGHGIKEGVGAFLRDCLGKRPIALVTDRNMARIWLQPLYETISRDYGLKPKIITVPAGEKAKSLSVYADVIEKLLYFGADRSWGLIAFGGGVVGDLTGFASATYQRGIPFVMIPTTLLADVDASIGGKVAIDFKKAKNAIGAFWQPSGVLIDTDYLSTLPQREHLAGLAEVLKYGIIQDDRFFGFVTSNAPRLINKEPEVLIRAIEGSFLYKKAIVEKDEKEANLRAVLNFGHTFGHAFEAHTHYRTFLHGEAIALGMVTEAAIAYLLKSTTKEEYAAIKEALQALGLPTKPPTIHPKRLETLLGYDKKKRGSRLNFIMLNRIGSVRIEPIATLELVEAWKKLLEQALP